MKLMDEAKYRQGQLTVTNAQKTFLQAGGPGSGRHASDLGQQAYQQTAKAQAATKAASVGATDAVTPNKALERTAAKEHMVAGQLHNRAAHAYIAEGNHAMVSQHRAAQEEHAGMADDHASMAGLKVKGERLFKA